MKCKAEPKGLAFLRGEMAKDFAKAFYASGAWQRCRDSYIRERTAIDGGMCEVCGQRLGLIVHHRVRLTEENITDPEVILGRDKLCYVCLECHNDIHALDIAEGRGVVKRCAFSADGQPIDLREV